jgi:hypothetical protein
MSAIVTINEVKIANLELAKDVAKNLGWNEGSKNVGGQSVDISFNLNSSRNVGLRLNKEGTYDVICDSDQKSKIIKDFVVPYTTEFVKNEIQLQGKTFSYREEEDEIVIEYDVQ